MKAMLAFLKIKINSAFKKSWNKNLFHHKMRMVMVVGCMGLFSSLVQAGPMEDFDGESISNVLDLDADHDGIHNCLDADASGDGVANLCADANPVNDQRNAISSFFDIDGGGFANHLDRDGHPDRIAGVGRLQVLDEVTSILGAGNTGGTYTGSSRSPVSNLGTTVENTYLTIRVLYSIASYKRQGQELFLIFKKRKR